MELSSIGNAKEKALTPNLKPNQIVVNDMNPDLQD